MGYIDHLKSTTFTVFSWILAYNIAYICLELLQRKYVKPITLSSFNDYVGVSLAIVIWSLGSYTFNQLKSKYYR